MPISTVLTTKIRLTMLCLSGFELYSRWVPLFNGVLSSITNNFLYPSNIEVRYFEVSLY